MFQLRNMLAAALLLPPNLLGECVPVGPHPKGNLKVIAILANGEELESTTAKLFELNTRTPRGLSRIPYGHYWLEVQAAGFMTSRQEIVIAQEHTTVRVRLSLGGECVGARPGRTAGRVNGTNSAKDLWIKALPLHGIGPVSEAPIDRQGNFLLSGLELGDHILLITDRSAVLYQGVHAIQGEAVNRFEIDLPPQARKLQ